MAVHQVFRRNGQYLCLCNDVETFSDNLCPTCDERNNTAVDAIKESYRSHRFWPVKAFSMEKLERLDPEERQYGMTEEQYRQCAQWGLIGIEREGKFTPLPVETFQDAQGNWIEGDTMSSPSCYSIDWRRAWALDNFKTSNYEALGPYAALPPPTKSKMSYFDADGHWSHYWGHIAGGPVPPEFVRSIEDHGLPPNIPTKSVYFDEEGREIDKYGYYNDEDGNILPKDQIPPRQGPPSTRYQQWLELQSTEIREKHLTQAELQALEDEIERGRASKRSLSPDIDSDGEERRPRKIQRGKLYHLTDGNKLVEGARWG